MVHRKKLHKLLVEKDKAHSVEAAEELIKAKLCEVNGVIIDNPKSEVLTDATIKILEAERPVGRGGLKLSGALDELNINPDGLVCADFGSSTGGFTEVLLNRGASKVYAVDTAKGELAWKLRSDDRVEVWEGHNATTLKRFPLPVDLITVDISLVPLRNIYATVSDCLGDQGEMLALLKPQYELPPDVVPKGGVVESEELQNQACKIAMDALGEYDLVLKTVVKSMLKGRQGNQEYFIYAIKSLSSNT